MSDEPHHFRSSETPARCSIITVSDTRDRHTDGSGTLLQDLCCRSGHVVAHQDILADDEARIRERVLALCESGTVDIILLTGGTGIAPRDVTHEAIAGLLEKRLDGFGELFRWLSFQDVGSAAMLSRAIAGTRGAVAIFALPGSPKAVRLAMEQLVLPRLGHMVALLRG